MSAPHADRDHSEQEANLLAGRLRDTGQQRFHIPHVGLQVRDCYVTDWREVEP